MSEVKDNTILNKKGNKRGTNQAFIDNQFKPGEVRNPNGRPPKEKVLTHYVDIELNRVPTIEIDGIDGKGMTWGQILVQKAFKLALGGSYNHLQEIWKRVEGPVGIKIGEGEGGSVLEVIIKKGETDGD